MLRLKVKLNSDFLGKIHPIVIGKLMDYTKREFIVHNQGCQES